MHMDHDEAIHCHEHTHADGTTHTHEHYHDHEHTHAEDVSEHTHEHTHADGTTHTHPHHHDHDHHHDHGCEQTKCAGDCASCGSVSPRDELVALMKYMVGHNASHAAELAQLAKQLQELGETTAYDQVMAAVSDFEKGNLRLSTVLAAMNVQ